MQNLMINIDTHLSFILELKWIGEINIDLSAMLLSGDGKINEKADFVFYNSLNRSIPFDSNRFKTKRQWKDRTVPVSLDHSVEFMAEENSDSDYFEDSDYCSEYIKVSLSKIRPTITQIKFIASIYDFSSGIKFGDLKKCIVNLIDVDTSTTFSSYDLTSLFHDHPHADSIVFSEILKHDNGNWDISILEESFIGGLPAVVERYC